LYSERSERPAIGPSPTMDGEAREAERASVVGAGPKLAGVDNQFRAEARGGRQPVPGRSHARPRRRWPS